MKSLTKVGSHILSVFVALTLCLFIALPARQAHAADGSPQAAQASQTASQPSAASSQPGTFSLQAGGLATAGSKTSGTPASYAGVGLTMRAKIDTAGWGDWVTSGVEFGDRFTKLDMKGVQIKLTGMEGLKGSVLYQTYKRQVGWQPWSYDGSATTAARHVESLKVKLAGAVSKHYDILYRVYMSDAGWQPWVKNGTSAGLVGKGQRIQAAQVTLAPKTAEALGKSANAVGVHYEAHSFSDGWQNWRANGKVAGSGKTDRALNGLAVKVDAGAFTGGVKYSAFTTAATWTDWGEDGATVGGSSRIIEAVKIRLTGKIAKKYDVYYRAYVKRIGWLGWAKNGQVAGSTFLGTRLNGLQVRLVPKGADAPGETAYRTINQLEKIKTLNGIDIASWQAGINISNVDADFVIVKSTQGDWYANPYFREHADATLKSGKLLGIYHFADLRGNATQQADYFIKSVGPYRGKAMLFLDFEAEITTIPDVIPWVETFMARVHRKTGVKPLIYLSQSLTHEHDWSNIASKYELWVAQYLYRNFNTGYLNNPDGGTDLGYWKSARIYQYSSTGEIAGYSKRLDINKFYGSARMWKEFAAVR